MKCNITCSNKTSQRYQCDIALHSGKEDKETCLQLINEFRDTFAVDLSELGCTNVLEMDIKEVGQIGSR